MNVVALAEVSIAPVWYAVIAAVVGAIAPVLTWWMARKDKEQDWKRQDVVADRLLKSNEEMAKKAASDNKVIDSKLDAIHTLNNGAAKAGLERELDDAKSKLVMLRIIAGLQKGKPDPDAQGLIEDTQKKIARLTKAIADHDRQTVIAEDRIENPQPVIDTANKAGPPSTGKT